MTCCTAAGASNSASRPTTCMYPHGTRAQVGECMPYDIATNVKDEYGIKHDALLYRGM
jgi:hypothetical protein